jgi:flagellar biosynthetic protein FliR
MSLPAAVGWGHWTASDQVWAAGLIFARVGAIIMLLPGLGEATVPAKIRLSLALVFSLALTPLLASKVPALPDSVGASVGWVIRETLTGLMIGGLIRVMLSALAVAGEIVSLQTTLSFAQTANPLQAQPSSSIGSFLALLGVVLIFDTGLHHYFIAAIVNSYDLFATTKRVMLGDAATLAIHITGQAFLVGVQLAAPVMVFALVFNAAMGLVARAMPQFQVFFAVTPLTLLLGLSVFALSLGVMGLAWIQRYQDVVAVFLRR